MDDGILLWVEASDRSYCLFVDDLIGEQQVVVKPLPTYLNSFELKNYGGITGCRHPGGTVISALYLIYSACMLLPLKNITRGEDE